MNGWAIFWSTSAIVSAVGFVFITFVVAMGRVGDLRGIFLDLTHFRGARNDA